MLSFLAKTFINLAMFYILLWIIAFVLQISYYLRISCYEAYWNSAPEEEFFAKLKNIIYEIDPNNIIFSNRNLQYKLNYVYSRMKKSQKNRFHRDTFKNGLHPRLSLLIKDYSL